MPGPQQNRALKGIALVATAFVVLALSLFFYEMLEDLHLAGMPRKTVDVSLAAGNREPLLARYRAFALSHGFKLAERHIPGALPGIDLRMTRWDAEIDVTSQTRLSEPSRQLVDDPSHQAIWVKFKGWLWWTDLREADALASKLVDITKTADRRAKIQVRTLSPP